MGNEATTLQNIPTINSIKQRQPPPLFPPLPPQQSTKVTHSPRVSCFDDDPEMNSIGENNKRTIREINERVQQLQQVKSARKQQQNGCEQAKGDTMEFQQQINKVKSMEARSFQNFLQRQRSFEDKKRNKIELCRKQNSGSKSNRNTNSKQKPQKTVVSPRTGHQKMLSPPRYESTVESTRTSQNNILPMPPHSERSKCKKLISQYQQSVQELTEDPQRLSYIQFAEMLRRVGFISQSIALTPQLIKQRTLLFQAWSELKCQQSVDSINLLSFIFAVMGEDLSQFWFDDRQLSKTQKAIRASQVDSAPSIWSDKTTKNTKQGIKFYSGQQIQSLAQDFQVFRKNRENRASNTLALAHHHRVLNQATRQGVINPTKQLSHAQFLNLSKKLQQIRQNKQRQKQEQMLFQPRFMESPRYSRQSSRQNSQYRHLKTTTDGPRPLQTDRTQQLQQGKDIVLHVDIKLNHQQMERITLNVTDSAGRAALDFVKKHNLDLKLVGHLTKVIQANIDKVKSQNGI